MRMKHCASRAQASARILALLTLAAAPLTAAAGPDALDTTIGSPGAVVADAVGNVFFSSPNVIFKLDISGALTQIAGGWAPGVAGDGGPAAQALLDIPFQYPELIHDPFEFGELVGALAVDPAGDLYIADAYNNRIRKIDANGTISTVFGTGHPGWAAPDASLHVPQGVAVDAAGNLFVADLGGRLLKVTRDNVIHLVTGNNCGNHPSPGLCAPEQIAIDSHEVVYVADGYCDVRKVDPAGVLTEVAGDPHPSLSQGTANWTCGYSGDGGPANRAALLGPYGVAADSAGNLYIADTYNSCIRRVDANGVITTFAGVCQYPSFSGDGGPAGAAHLNLPHGVAVDAAGSLYVADTANNRLRKIALDGTISTVAGNGSPSPVLADRLAGHAPPPTPVPPGTPAPPATPAVGGGGALGLGEFTALLLLAWRRHRARPQTSHLDSVFVARKAYLGRDLIMNLKRRRSSTEPISRGWSSPITAAAFVKALQPPALSFVRMRGFFLFLSVLSTAWAQIPYPTAPANVRYSIPHFPIKPGVKHIPKLLRHTEVARLPASITSDVVQTACVPEAADLGAMCGYVNVPFDRKHPKQGTIPIYFELYLHSGPGPAESAILANFGGPGVTTSGNRSSAFDLFGQNLDVHDMLLIDDRGRGLSGTLGVTNCLEVQQGTAPWDQALADCAAQLGEAASQYGTGDIAQDTEAVRAALGYEKVDYFGLSYGGTDVTAYATRFGEHLRSVVLDSPSGTPNLDKFVFEQTRTQADPRIVRLDCARSPTCSADHQNPIAELDALVGTIRFSPVEGDAYDANGNLTHVRIDEDALLNFVIHNTTGTFIATGELLAAAESLSRGDSGPLLRLGAEGTGPMFGGDNGDPTSYSAAAQFATSCVDHHQAWNWSATISERVKQYAEAVADLPADYFAPFSKTVATGEHFSWFGRECLFWQKPTPSSPVAPPHATYPFVPTLVLSGDMDRTVPLEETSQVAALFQDSTFLPVASAGHRSVFWSQCAANLASEFIETLQVGDTSCTRTPQAVVWPAVGRFPLLARDARPAHIDPHGTNQIGVAERKVVTVAVATATDALQRSMIGDGFGVGLRAGTFQTNYDPTWTTTLSDCAFATDVIVNGTIALESDNSLVADLVVAGPGTAGGTIHIAGFWEVLGPVGNFKVTGTLGGKRVAVLVPEA